MRPLLLLAPSLGGGTYEGRSGKAGNNWPQTVFLVCLRVSVIATFHELRTVGYRLSMSAFSIPSTWSCPIEWVRRSPYRVFFLHIVFSTLYLVEYLKKYHFSARQVFVRVGIRIFKIRFEKRFLENVTFSGAISRRHKVALFRTAIEKSDISVANQFYVIAVITVTRGVRRWMLFERVRC